MKASLSNRLLTLSPDRARLVDEHGHVHPEKRLVTRCATVVTLAQSWQLQQYTIGFSLN